MKWNRFLMAVILIALAACSSPTGPRLPQPDEGGTQPPPPKKHGLVVPVLP